MLDSGVSRGRPQGSSREGHTVERGRARGKRRKRGWQGERGRRDGGMKGRGRREEEGGGEGEGRRERHLMHK